MTWQTNPHVAVFPVKENPWGLTHTEYLIAKWLGEGFTTEEIGEKIHISRHTVYAHLERAKTRVAAENQTHLAVLVALNEAGVEFAT